MALPASVMTTTADDEGWRQPGCSTRCQMLQVIERGTWRVKDLVSHDPDSHETYGHALGRETHTTTPSRCVVGPLELDHATFTATLHGRPFHVTPIEWKLLWYLACRADVLCTQVELLVNVWGPEYAPRTHVNYGGTLEAHLLRVHLARIRKKLGQDATLIENRPAFGYRLVEP